VDKFAWGPGQDPKGMDGQFPILIAEDDQNDAFILKRALRTAGFNNPFHISKDGADVMCYMKGEEPYGDREKYQFPRILFTDLKMPIVDGFELLQWLQNHEEYSVIPRLVLTSSQQPQDIHRAYQLGANSYLVKPATFDGLVKLLRLVFEYWETCEKPQLPGGC
jgi:CheY-like chemotaxis protein